MPLEMRMWRIDGQTLKPPPGRRPPAENGLHQFVKKHPWDHLTGHAVVRDDQ